jgi:hypothetical protein
MPITSEKLKEYQSQWINSDDAKKQQILAEWTLAVYETIDQNKLHDLSIVSEKLSNSISQRKLQMTRDEQAYSVNPKITNSPYVNILGLRRSFRDTTQTGLIVASTLFGILALGLIGNGIYAIRQKGIISAPRF